MKDIKPMQKCIGIGDPSDNMDPYRALQVITSTFNWTQKTTGNQCNSCNKSNMVEFWPIQ